MKNSQSNRPKSATSTRESFIWWTITQASYPESPLLKFLTWIGSIFRRLSKNSKSTNTSTKHTESISLMCRNERIRFSNNLEMHLSYLQLMDQRKTNPRSVPLKEREIKEILDETFQEAYRLMPTEVILKMEEDLNDLGVITLRQAHSSGRVQY